MVPNEKHLEMIQSVVSRMAQNSFTLKGWAVVLVSALFAIGVTRDLLSIALVTVIPVVTFWMLDAYYLWQERQYRLLFDAARNPSSLPNYHYASFTMDAAEAIQFASYRNKRHASYPRSLLSRTELGFYLPLMTIIVVISYVAADSRDAAIRQEQTKHPIEMEAGSDS